MWRALLATCSPTSDRWRRHFCGLKRGSYLRKGASVDDSSIDCDFPVVCRDWGHLRPGARGRSICARPVCCGYPADRHWHPNRAVRVMPRGDLIVFMVAVAAAIAPAEMSAQHPLRAAIFVCRNILILTGLDLVCLRLTDYE